MTATKTKLSVTVSNALAHLLDTVAKSTDVPKSELVEDALKLWHEKQLEEAGRQIAKIEREDPAIQATWLDMDLDLLNEWEWKE